MKVLHRVRVVLAMAFIAAGLFSAVIPALAMAQTNPYDGVCKNGGGASPVCAGAGTDPIAGKNGVIVSVTTILAVVAGIVSIVLLVLGGIKYITSAGDSSGVSSAKATITAALVGLVIAALARPLVTFVIGKL